LLIWKRASEQSEQSEQARSTNQPPPNHQLLKPNPTGDNTWPKLFINPSTPYHSLRTSVANNGYAGFVIIPRYATEIYYNCSTPSQNEVLYNNLYSTYWGGPSTIDDIVRREAVRVVQPIAMGCSSCATTLS